MPVAGGRLGIYTDLIDALNLVIQILKMINPLSL